MPKGLQLIVSGESRIDDRLVTFYFLDNSLNTLDREDNITMGLYLLGSDLFPFLGIGCMLAFRHVLGKVPDDKE